MARKKSGAVLCSSCRQIIGVNEKRCPHCGAIAPGLFGFAPALQRVFRERIDPVSLLVGASVVVYALTLLVDPRCIHTGIDLDFGSPSGEALRLFGMTGRFAMVEGRPWTLLTAIFLHGSLLHLGFNLMWVRSLAPPAVELFGKGRAVVIFILSGVGCFLASDLWSGAPTLGASGAIFGLMGALLAYGRKRGGEFGAQIRRDMIMWAGLMFFLGLAMPGVNNAAHVGGFITGLLLGRVLPARERKRETRSARILALVLLLGTLAAFLVSVATGLSGFVPGRCA
ncbi:MAG: rhomboid family intramembrane serine protease [Deltaproteobacteria bacterium]|nr:MAG: rhomboid family intramembrane serine protease [Deltaproteobacteria bacterium]